MKPMIKLWESVGLGLIIEMPTGILYSNQTGGFSCLQPSLEGTFLPLRNDHSFWELMSPERELREYFEGPKHGGTGATSGLDTEDADAVDGVDDAFVGIEADGEVFYAEDIAHDGVSALPATQAGIEDVAQPVAEEVHAQGGDGDGQTGIDGEPGQAGEE